MKIGITGPHGNLGTEFIKLGCIPLLCDITEPRSIQAAVMAHQPDVIINCAAVSNVDACEDGKQTDAYLVNLRGPGYLRWNFNHRIIHISTGYVFDGKHGPYKESAKPNPVQHYGWTKWGGEVAFLADRRPGDVVVRTMGLFGGERSDFVTMVVDSLLDDMEIDVTTEVSFNPTYIPHLAEAILKLIEIPDPDPIVNIVGSRCLSRYEFAMEIAEVFGLQKTLINPCEHVPGWKALRPKNAGLKTDLARKLGLPIYDPRVGLQAIREKEAIC